VDAAERASSEVERSSAASRACARDSINWWRIVEPHRRLPDARKAADVEPDEVVGGVSVAAKCVGVLVGEGRVSPREAR
jgi:hypothetical protein